MRRRIKVLSEAKTPDTLLPVYLSFKTKCSFFSLSVLFQYITFWLLLLFKFFFVLRNQVRQNQITLSSFRRSRE